MAWLTHAHVYVCLCVHVYVYMPTGHCVGNVSVDVQDGTVLVQSFTGPIDIGPAGVPFNFDILATPLRPVDLRQHFTTRYFHFGGTFPPLGMNLTMLQAVEEIAALGATWVNIHQGSNLNP